MVETTASIQVPYILAYKSRNFGQKLELFSSFDLYTGHQNLQCIFLGVEETSEMSNCLLPAKFLMKK
jgi:hypothetical protein